jgi:hypothetical protein
MLAVFEEETITKAIATDTMAAKMSNIFPTAIVYPLWFRETIILTLMNFCPEQARSPLTTEID